MTDLPVFQKQCKVINKHGLHTRSAASIVECVSQFNCKVFIATEHQESEANDMIRLLLLEAVTGTVLTIRAEGEDAEDAVKSLDELIASGFHEVD